MLFTICHRKFQFGHQSSWNMHFSDETMGENERDGEKRTEKRVNTHTDTAKLLLECHGSHNCYRKDPCSGLAKCNVH